MSLVWIDVLAESELIALRFNSHCADLFSRIRFCYFRMRRQRKNSARWIQLNICSDDGHGGNDPNCNSREMFLISSVSVSLIIEINFVGQKWCCRWPFSHEREMHNESIIFSELNDVSFIAARSSSLHSFSISLHLLRSHCCEAAKIGANQKHFVGFSMTMSVCGWFPVAVAISLPSGCQ